MKDNPKVSVVIPVLGRPEKLKKCLEAIKQNADYDNYEIILEHDSFENRQGCPKTFKRGVEKSSGELVLFLGQDSIPQKGFMKYAVEAMSRFPDGWGLVCLNDGVHNGEFVTGFLASKKLLPLLDGEFFSTEYEHCGCDVELSERCMLMGRYIYEPNAAFYHDNPLIQGTEWDEETKIAYDPDRHKRDQATYDRRKAIWGLPFTGERVVPDKMWCDQRTYAEHLARYEFAKDFLIGNQILDAACGTGYGTDMICGEGCDISEDAIAYARASNPGTNYFIADLNQPNISKYYDCVVSFETIEHLSNPMPFIQWIKSHAKRLIFSIPVNNPSQYHAVIYSVDDIKNLFSDFHRVDWYQQNWTSITPLEEDDCPVFIIGVADVEEI